MFRPSAKSHRLVVATIIFICSPFCLPEQISIADESPNQGELLGTATCSSSNCHGSALPRAGSNILQNEYTTWQKHDHHSQAYAVLSSERSRIMASSLNIADPKREKLCLQCHSTVASATVGNKFQVEDGVTCEGCHGAAGRWIKEHSQQGNSHQQNLMLGMRDLVSPEKRVALCANCHVGHGETAVLHRLIAAGHPRLSFELDTFSMIQPKHWIVDQDYMQRKGSYDSARSWLVGQIALAVGECEKLKSSTATAPELSNFYCYSCHHSLSEQQWRTREYHGHPGELRVNLAHLEIVREALAVVSPQLSNQLATRIPLLQASLGHPFETGRDPKIELNALIALLNSKALAAVEQASNEGRFSRTATEQLLNHLLEYASSTRFLPYEIAEQVAMGISSLVQSLDPSGELYRSPIDSLYAALRDSDGFQPDKFTTAASNFRQLIKK